MDSPRTLPVRCPIKLTQALKLADVVDNGAEAAALVATGDVRVNGEVERRRGRQLVDGDLIRLELARGPLELLISAR